MASPDANTFDLVPPRRPGTDDFNGIAKKDRAGRVPNPETQPNAPEWNTIEHVLLALSRTAAAGVFSVTGGASPVLASFSSATSKLISANFTVTRSGPGDVSITWPADAFPTPANKPVVGLNTNGTPGMSEAVNISNGVRVRTWSSAGAPTDLSFTVQVF